MKNSQNNKTSQNIINNKNLYLHQEIQEENKRIKDRFKVLVEKEEEIKEEIKLFEDIKNYEEKLKIFEKKIKKKKLEIITDGKTPFLVIKGDKNKKFDISKKHKNLLKEFDEIFEEYSEIIKKIHIDTDSHYLPNISILENIYILHLIVMSENENFIKEFKSNINIAVILYDYKKTYRKYNFIEKVFGRKINIENLRLSPYLENYDFFKDKVNNINEKIFELFKKENNPYSYMNDYTQSIFNIKNEELSNLVKNYLIEKNDFENIYKYLGEFEVDEDLFEKLKSSLLSEKYFDFSANNCSKNYKEKTKKFNKKFLESLNLEEFLEVFKNLKWFNNKEDILKSYLEGKEKEEIENIFQKIYEETGEIFFYFLKKYNFKINYKKDVKQNFGLIYSKYFNNFPVKEILLKNNYYYENGVKKERIFSEEELKMIDDVIEKFEGYNNIISYFLEYLNYKIYNKIQNALKDEEVINLFKKVVEEGLVPNDDNNKFMIFILLGDRKLNKEDLEDLLEKINFIKQNKYFNKIENKVDAINVIFEREIDDIENFLKEFHENNLSEIRKELQVDLKIKGDDFLKINKDERKKYDILEKIKESKDFFYEEFYNYIKIRTKKLNLEETKDFLKKFDKKIKNIKESYEEYIILKTKKRIDFSQKYQKNYLEYFEKALNLMNILERSRSSKIKDLSDNIFDIIIENENPEEAITKIEEIFIENRLPFTAELFRIFSILYSEEKVLDGISEKSSPYLQILKEKGNPEMIYNTFFKDLLKTHIYSGNRSLKKFLQENLEAKKIYKKYENGESLTEEEKNILYQNTLTLATIIQNKEVKIGKKTKNFGNFEKNINEILKKLQLKNISEVFKHFEKKFLKGTGFENMEQIIDFMEKNISEKNEKSKNLENFEIENGDFIKGFEANIYYNIGNNGFIARDFLGTKGESDETPFDIDMIKVGNESFDEIINSSTASKYGNTFAIIKSTNQEIFESTPGDVKSYKNHNFEAFKTGALGENHYGIRTGFPTSLIDFYIHKSTDTEETYNFFYSIAKSGIYIPVLDENKNIIFSYEDFKKFRKIFSGIKEFSKENIKIETKNKNPNILSKIIQNYPKQEDIDEVENFTNKIFNDLESILEKFGIKKKQYFSKEKIGYEIHSIGSTKRKTFLPGDNFDFDLNIKLDEESYNKIKDETSEFLKIFEKNNDFEKYENTDGNGESQVIQFLKLKKIINGKEIEVDLSFSKLLEDDVYDKNKTLEEQYENIRKNYGEGVYKNVIANIRAAKKFLKENNIYKIYEGGLLGVGVETWILNNNGSFEKAVKSFLEASLDENGETLNYSDFKKKYFIYSAGENIKGRGNDKIENFIFKIGENGYFKMLEALKKL